MHKKPRIRWNATRDPLFGPLGKYVASFEEALWEQGYPKDVTHIKIRVIWHLNEWLFHKRVTINNLDDKMIDRFFRYYQKYHRSSGGFHLTLKQLLNWLQNTNIVPRPICVENDTDIFTVILKAFTNYLRNERGLSSETLRKHIPVIRRFLAWRFGSDRMVPVDIKPNDVTKYLLHQTKKYKLSNVQYIACVLRSFFRFLLFTGDITSDLASCVPTVANRQRSNIPKYLRPKDINRLLRSCDLTKNAGIRDYAMLLLMARLGLRAGEILVMTLDDINWEEGTIIIHGKRGRDEIMPLPKDVGSAIVTYLKKSRPKCFTRRLFVRINAPFKKFARNSSVCRVVRSACKRAGLSPKHQGAHLLRHSLATGMLNKGASMAEIAEILRHRSTQTTEIYAKVDMQSLREFAQPWPE